MNRPDLSPKTVLLTLLAVLLGWGLYSSIEFYDETIQSSWSREALRNPYLAAQQFLRQIMLFQSRLRADQGRDAFASLGKPIGRSVQRCFPVHRLEFALVAQHGLGNALFGLDRGIAETIAI